MFCYLPVLQQLGNAYEKLIMVLNAKN